ncbi:hypothetical protein K3495_g10864 [Podosphaera aphanis]|nr:hypothetical protein K3495_g10864 [Podosphaera aphanis]
MSATNPQTSLSFPRETFAKLSPRPYLLAHLQPPDSALASRVNGRSPTQFRPPHINNGSLTHAEGSAVVRIGDTTVVCGVRGEILRADKVAGLRRDRSSTSPAAGLGYNEAKELDLLVPNIELDTGCSPKFIPGQPPSILAQSLSMRIYNLLHSSSLIDTEELKIFYQSPEPHDLDEMDEDDKVVVEEPEVKAFWTLYIDLLFISLDGNPFDAAWAAVISALKDTRLPKAYWDPDTDLILCEAAISKSKKLHLRGLPIATTVSIFKEREQARGSSRQEKYWILVDPDTFEESLCDESVTVVLDQNEGRSKLLGISKSGGVVVGPTYMKEITNLAEKRWTEWHAILNK